MHHGSSRQEIGCHFPEILGEVRAKLSRVTVVCMTGARGCSIALALERPQMLQCLVSQKKKCCSVSEVRKTQTYASRGTYREFSWNQHHVKKKIRVTAIGGRAGGKVKLSDCGNSWASSPRAPVNPLRIRGPTNIALGRQAAATLVRTGPITSITLRCGA